MYGVCIVVICMTIIKEVPCLYPRQIPSHPTEIFKNYFLSVLRHVPGYDLKYVTTNSMPLSFNDS